MAPDGILSIPNLVKIGYAYEEHGDLTCLLVFQKEKSVTKQETEVGAW